MSTDTILQRTPRPFRSHRTLRMGFANAVFSLGAFLVGLAGAYGAAVYAWAPCMRFATSLVTPSGTMSLADTYLGIVYVVPAPFMPAVSEATAIWTAAACALLLLASAVLPAGRTPLRYWINANLLVLGGSALYVFFHGTVGYDAAPFMLLMARTGLLTIAAIVPFLMVVSALLPLTFLERAGMFVCGLLLALAVCTVRIAAFALFLQHFGAIPQANLYIFAGPLLDVAYFIAVYSVTVSIAAARISRLEAAWQWL